MNSIFNQFIFHLLSLMITFGTPISGQETPISNNVLNSGGSPTSEINQYSPTRSILPHMPICLTGCRLCGLQQKTRYLIVPAKVSFFEAFVLCKQAGMELASISSLEEEVALETYARTIAKNVGHDYGYWIAGTRYGSGESEFVWLTTGKPLIYRNFVPGQPDNLNGNEACLEFVLEKPNIFLWHDLNCDFKLSYICQSE